MEDVLEVYTRPRDPDRPLVCLDETSKQLIAETRTPVPMKKGQPARADYEYERNGTANMFMMFAPLEGWRHVKPTERRTAVDYAHALKDLSDDHFPHATKIVLVQDNLNTHTKASLYEAFPAPEARRLVERGLLCFQEIVDELHQARYCCVEAEVLQIVANFRYGLVRLPLQFFQIRGRRIA